MPEPIPISETALAYLAGVIDCDGYISIQRTKKANRGRCTPAVYHALIVGISGTRRGPHDFAANLFGGNIARYVPKNPRHRAQFQWSATGPTAAAFIAAIRPFLIVKAEQGDIGMEFQRVITAHVAEQRRDQKPPYRITDAMRTQRDQLYARMTGFNQPKNRRSAIAINSTEVRANG